MLKAEHLSRTYTVGEVEVHALRDTTVRIDDGEFVSIIGKSGAGKSTLMYQLSLLDRPSTGTVYFDDLDTAELSNNERTLTRLRHFGYVFQDYALLPELSAEENVMLPLMMDGRPTNECRGMAERVLNRLGLSERLKNLPSQLSGGEQQRVSIARAIAHNPRVLFADEPTANLDTETSGVLLTYLHELAKEGLTIIMVTHEIDYAKQSKRVITMSDGQIIKDESL